MNTKKKLAISITVLVLAIIAAVISVIGAWAATSQRVANLFKIEYTADNVNADVVVSCIEKGESWTTSGRSKQISFNLESSQTTETFSIGDINVDVENDYVLFVHEFTNKNTKPESGEGKPMYVTLESYPSMDNATIHYAKYDNVDSFASHFPGADRVTCDYSMKYFMQMNGSSDLSEFGTITVSTGVGASAYVLILISFETFDESFSYNTSFKFKLSSTAPTT